MRKSPRAAKRAASCAGCTRRLSQSTKTKPKTKKRVEIWFEKLTLGKTLEDDVLVLLAVRFAQDDEQVASGEG